MLRNKSGLKLRVAVALICLTMLLGSAGAEGIMNETGLPIVKPDAEYSISIMWAARAMAPDPSEVKWIQYAEEQTGVKFEWMKVAEDSVAEKINLMLASGDVPDVFANGITRAMVLQYIDQDMFMPTEELVDEYVPNLQQIFEDNPEYKAICTSVDGHRYGFPVIEEMYGLVNTPSILYIYQPWLDALGLDMPTTLDEFVEVLKAFRDNDPNGNGIQDEIPLSAYGYMDLLTYFKMAFGGASDNGDHLSVLDGKVVSTAVDDAAKENLKFMNMLYT